MKLKNAPGMKMLRKVRAGTATIQEYEAALLIRTKKNRSSKGKTK